jgi:hypothetical protein
MQSIDVPEARLIQLEIFAFALPQKGYLVKNEYHTEIFGHTCLFHRDSDLLALAS